VTPVEAAAVGFWLGGMVTVVAQMMIEPMPELAEQMPLRFSAVMMAMAVFWPAALALRFYRQRQVQREQEAEDAEDERIEATRRPSRVVAACEHCNESTELDPSSPKITTWLYWMCPSCHQFCKTKLADCAEPHQEQ
jgi:hypothetical protein